MITPEFPHKLTGNRLLDALPPEDIGRLRSHLEIVSVALKYVIYEPDQPITHVYFPTGCVISLVTYLEEGLPVEMATIGREGMVGLPIFLGADTMPSRAFGQVPGDAMRITALALTEEIKRNGPLVRVLNRYTLALFNQVAQTTACNRVHFLEQRCARWLLQTHDRVASDQFLLTQEFLAQMLGVRRSGVSAAAGLLQKAGFIRYARGRITILDRPGLEGVACECYGVIKKEFDRLLGSGS
jgi:CRP-like cAMP-binding protein